MASWNSYIDTLIENSKIDSVAQIDKAAIIGQDGALWTTHDHPQALKLSAAEAQVIGNVMKTNDYGSIREKGIFAEEMKYMFLRGTDEDLLAKKVDQGAISCVPSTMGVVVAHCIEGGQQGKVNMACGAIADYLKSLNM